MEKLAKDGKTRAVAREVAANFKAWFERNFVNRRAGRIGDTSYSRAGRFDDRTGDWTWYSDAYGRAYYDYTEPLTPDEEAFLLSNPLILGQMVLGVTDLRGLRCLRRGLTMQANRLQQRSYRSRYYAKDNERRRRLAAERRKISRRTTLNPCPTPDMLREAFSRVGDSVEAKLRFGGMLHDLACYVDSCLRYDAKGNIVGRNAGIKGWLAENAPELHARYKTVMRYKALAMRLRQAAGVEDPVPTSTLLDNEDETATDRDETHIKYYAQESQDTWQKNGGGGEIRPQGSITRGRNVVHEMCAGCRNTLVDAFRRVDRLLDEYG